MVANAVWRFGGLECLLYHFRVARWAMFLWPLGFLGILVFLGFLGYLVFLEFLGILLYLGHLRPLGILGFQGRVGSKALRWFRAFVRSVALQCWGLRFP